MNNWKEKKIGELGFTYAGLSGKTQKDFGKGKPYIPFMNIMANGKIDPKFLNYVDVLENEHQNAVQKGDLFFTTSSETPEEVGMTSVLLDDIGECYLNSFCFGFRLNNYDDLIPDYAPYLFRGNEVRKQIINLGQGYTRFNLPKTELLKKLTLNLPSLPEQQKTSEILTSVDTIIEKTQAAITKYKAIKQGMLHDLFTRGIDLQTGKLRPRCEEAPELYKESKLGWIPREWDEKIVDDIAKVNGRVGWKGYTVADLRDFGPLALGATHIDKENKLDLTNPIHLSMEKYIESPEIMVQFGDLLIVQRGTIGKIVVIDKQIGEATINPSMVLLNSIRINNFFLYYQLCSFIGQLQIELLTTQTGVPMISQEQIKNINLVIPKKPEETNAIAERLKTIDAMMDNEQTYLKKMQSLKNGLIEDLLSGRKKVIINEPQLYEQQG